MRHRVRGRKLGRTTAHRKALFRNQLTALFTHERIITTLAKAKELRPMAERMVTLAGTGSLPARRKVLTMVPDKVIVRRLFDEIAPRFTDRPGGYTRIMRLGRRHGDGAEMAIIEFVDFDLAEHDGDQGHCDHGGRCNANKHTNHENSLFHLNSPSQVSVTQSILPVWRKFLKDYVSHMVLGYQDLIVGYFLQGAGILQRFIGLRKQSGLAGCCPALQPCQAL